MDGWIFSTTKWAFWLGSLGFLSHEWFFFWCFLFLNEPLGLFFFDKNYGLFIFSNFQRILKKETGFQKPQQGRIHDTFIFRNGPSTWRVLLRVTFCPRKGANTEVRRKKQPKSPIRNPPWEVQDRCYGPYLPTGWLMFMIYVCRSMKQIDAMGLVALAWRMLVAGLVAGCSPVAPGRPWVVYREETARFQTT